MRIVLTDKMLDYWQGLEKSEARAFLEGIRMAQDAPGQETPADKETAATPDQAPPLAKSPRVRASSANNRGAYGEILRLLFTGPATYSHLQKACRYSRQVILWVISQGQRQGDIVPMSPGQEGWQLTPQGRHIAAVFVRNPGLKLLTGLAKQAARDAAKLPRG